MKVSDVLKQTYNLDFSNINILECGASVAEETRDLLNNCNCFYIEACCSEYIKLLDLSYNVSYYALTNHNGQTDFFITSHIGNSSILHSEPHKEELIYEYNSSFTKTTVPATTYKNYIENIINKTIDILVLDIEGHETIVLETFHELTLDQLPKIICIECGYDWLLRKTILLDLGYTIDFYQYNNCFLSHSLTNIDKNIENIDRFNKDNKQFIWHGKLIYINELV